MCRVSGGKGGAGLIALRLGGLQPAVFEWRWQFGECSVDAYQQGLMASAVFALLRFQCPACSRSLLALRGLPSLFHLVCRGDLYPLGLDASQIRLSVSQCGLLGGHRFKPFCPLAGHSQARLRIGSLCGGVCKGVDDGLLCAVGQLRDAAILGQASHLRVR